MLTTLPYRKRRLNNIYLCECANINGGEIKKKIYLKKISICDHTLKL